MITKNDNSMINMNTCTIFAANRNFGSELGTLFYAIMRV